LREREPEDDRVDAERVDPEREDDDRDDADRDVERPLDPRELALRELAPRDRDEDREDPEREDERDDEPRRDPPDFDRDELRERLPLRDLPRDDFRVAIGDPQVGVYPGASQDSRTSRAQHDVRRHALRTTRAPRRAPRAGRPRRDDSWQRVAQHPDAAVAAAVAHRAWRATLRGHGAASAHVRPAPRPVARAPSAAARCNAPSRLRRPSHRCVWPGHSP
jgi:hypothetical protein